MTEAEAKEAGITEGRKLYFRINDAKTNLAPPAEKADWIKLEGVSMDNDPIGLKPDWVGVATKWEWPDPFDGVSIAQLREFQNRLGEGEWRVDPRAAKWAGLLLGELLGWIPSADVKISTLNAAVKNRLAQVIKKCGTTAGFKIEERPDEHREDRKYLEKGVPL